MIFIATPQHGSFVAANSIPQLIGRLVRLPFALTHSVAEVITGNQDAMRLDSRNIRVGSVYGMTPGSPFIRSLAVTPVAPTVKAHSIIAVKGDGPIETGDDGVVEYRSAHIDEAVSELVIRSGHSVQGDARAVAEVRRILLEHYAQACPQGCVPSSVQLGQRPAVR